MNRISEILNIKYPIIQAPMSWLTSAELVAAVSNAGGLGVLGANAGQSRVTASVEETTERMRAEIRKVKSLTDKPFGLNILFARDMSFSAPMIELAVEEKVPVLAAVAVDDYDYAPRIAELKKHGIKILLRPGVPTAENARQAEKSGADIFVATGFDAGGVAPSSQIGTFSIVPRIADSVNIPVLAAGGIGDIRGVRAALALGAEGVYLGTAFMTVAENPLADNLKQKMLGLNEEDLDIFTTTMGVIRSIKTELTAELLQMRQNGADTAAITQKMFGNGGGQSGLITGNDDNSYFTAGPAIGFAKEIKTAKALIDELMADFQ